VVNAPCLRMLCVIDKGSCLSEKSAATNARSWGPGREDELVRSRAPVSLTLQPRSRTGMAASCSRGPVAPRTTVPPLQLPGAHMQRHAAAESWSTLRTTVTPCSSPERFIRLAFFSRLMLLDQVIGLKHWRCIIVCYVQPWSLSLPLALP
jgi:hypothetical protein